MKKPRTLRELIKVKHRAERDADWESRQWRLRVEGLLRTDRELTEQLQALTTKDRWGIVYCRKMRQLDEVRVELIGLNGCLTPAETSHVQV